MAERKARLGVGSQVYRIVISDNQSILTGPYTVTEWQMSGRSHRASLKSLSESGAVTIRINNVAANQLIPAQWVK